MIANENPTDGDNRKPSETICRTAARHGYRIPGTTLPIRFRQERSASNIPPQFEAGYSVTITAHTGALQPLDIATQDDLPAGIKDI